MTASATLAQIKSYRQGVTTALLDQHARKGLTVNVTAPILREARPVEPLARPVHVSYLNDLMARLAKHAPKVHADAQRWIAGLPQLTRVDVNRAIDAVKRHLAAPAEVVEAPKATGTSRTFAEIRIALANVPTDTRYALEVGPNDWRFYRVTGAGAYRSVQVGHADGYGIAWERMTADAQLATAARIAKDPHEAMLNFGRHLGRCGHCGRTLTNRESREAGIGPRCAEK